MTGGSIEPSYADWRRYQERIVDGYHAGEIALIQGMHGRPQLDLWRPQPPAAEVPPGP